LAQQTQQIQALAYATLVASLMAQLRTIQNAVNAALLTNTDQSYDTILQALPTFAFNANGSQGAYDQTAGSGTVALTNGLTSVTFSAAQTGLSGSYLIVAGDSSNGLYLIGSGSGTSWAIGSPYGGATAAAASWGTAAPNNAHPIAIAAPPAGTPLNMARNNVLTATGCLANFQSYMAGIAITTQANTPQKFADLLTS
jgi:hypothetical protein